jgi:hypothetical protein
MTKFINKSTIGLILFLLIVSIIAVKTFYEEKLIRSNYRLTYGMIIDYPKRAGGRLGRSYTYDFLVKGQKFHGTFSEVEFCQRYYSTEETLEINREKIPVIYYSKNPKVNEMLFKKIHYSKYNLEYPDSLKVFLNKYFECK